MRKYLLMGLVVLCCAGCQQTEQPVVSEETTELTTVKIGETSLTIPCTVQELEETGYTLMASSSPEVYRNVDNMAYFTSPEGFTLVANLGTKEESCDLDDGMVIDLLADTGNTTGTTMSIYGDISLTSTIEEVEAVYGSPNVSLDGSNLYSKSIPGGMEYDMVAVATMGDKVVRIEVCNTQGYIEYESVLESSAPVEESE